MKRIILTTTALIGLLFLTACGGEDEVQQVVEMDFAMDTLIEIRIFYMDDSRNRNEAPNRQLALEAIEYVRYLEGVFSRFVEGTDVWRLNHAGGEFVEVSPYLVDVLHYSLYFRELTGGRMDVTIGAVSDLWIFEANPELGIDVRVPTEEELAIALPSVGADIIIEGNRVRLGHPDTQLDLGGIAKGFIADRVAEFLRDAGVEHAIVNLGGDNVAIGGRPDGMPFGMGIPAPGTIGMVDGHIGVALVENASMAGSGIDQRSFELDGVLYHHILDVDTGMPVDTNKMSVFVIAESGILSEGLTTIVYTMGVEAGLTLVESIPNAHAILIVDTGRDDGWQMLMTTDIGFNQTDYGFILNFN
ncbi:MAG: FAD:protein FMN transferase [Defluviitaleaceae bacterium]|nr:FAD:protein FMN transferase [Defluviitaleaceae bacterium]